MLSGMEGWDTIVIRAEKADGEFFRHLEVYVV